MKDGILSGLVIVAFAILVTAHVAIAFGLVRRTPRWRAPLAFFFPLAAPYFAYREQMRVRAYVWGFGAVLYLASLIAASF